MFADRPEGNSPATAALHVLVLQPDAELYGACRSLLRTLNSIPTAERPRITACFPFEGPARDAYAAAGFTTIVEPRLVVVRRSLRSPRGVVRMLLDLVLSTRRLRKYCRTHAVDLVHSNSGYVLSGASMRMVSAAPRHIWMLREFPTHSNAFVRVLRVLLRRNADAVAAISNASASLAPAGVPVCLVPNGYRPRSVRSGSSPRRLVRVGMIGRISETKGQRIVLEAIQLLPTMVVQNMELWIIGTVFDANIADAQALVDDLEQLPRALSERVAVLGHQAEVGDVFDELDILVVATTTGEGFSTVVLEAQAHGVAVVAAAAGGVADLVQHGQGGLLVPPCDTEAIAQALERVICDVDLRAQLVAGGHEVASRFTLDRSAARLGAAWQLALGAPTAMQSRGEESCA